MTLKQSRLIKAIPESSTIMEAGIKAGYSPSARKMYTAGTRRLILDELNRLGYDRQSMLQRFNIGSAVALAKKDIGNYHRGHENICKLQGFMNDNQPEQSSTIEINFIIKPTLQASTNDIQVTQPIDVQAVTQDKKVT